MNKEIRESKRSQDTAALLTEQRNPRTAGLDRADALSIVRMMNEEDKSVPAAVEAELPHIAQAVDAIVDAITAGGRLIYCGAGTSGRLGILDASECPPTFGTDPSLVVGLIAGGERAKTEAVENAEDAGAQCAADLAALRFGARDILCGISASGRTPYVLGGMQYARTKGAKVIAVSCVPQSAMAQAADIAITPVVGPEIVTGSTRLKAGTAQKLVLNMLTTASMIRLGHTYENLMVDVRPTNRKLRERACRMVQETMLPSPPTTEEVEAALEAADYNPKTAILMLKRGLRAEEAREILAAAGGHLYLALGAEISDK